MNGKWFLKLKITPHSPRAGYASDAYASGDAVANIMDGGRWMSESSFRCDVDVVSTASIMVPLRAKGLVPSVQHAQSNLLSFFASASSFRRNGDGVASALLADASTRQLQGRGR